MSFDSAAFLLFLPLVTLAHWAVPHRLRWIVLLGASYVFYAWWDARLVLLILSVTGVSYGAARLLSRAKRPGARRCWLLLALGCSLGVLVYFKYFNLLGRTGAALLSLLGRDAAWNAWDIVLPVGVSFYTFQALSYVVDVYRGDLPAETHFGYYALYIAFFPQLVAGPIERAGSLLPQLRESRTLKGENLRAGGLLLLSGFFRKLVVADLCAPIVNAVYGAQAPDGSAVVLGTLLFAVQIYCDFAGYSEIAAGSARLLGVRLMRNFDRPYAARSIRDFWRRWHISLTQWFTDYVYIPLGGSRRGLARQILATLAVFSLSGLWHGAAWSYVAWGLMHGSFMVLSLMWHKRAGARGAWGQATSWLERGLTLAGVCFAWIFFRAGSLERALALVGALVAPWRPAEMLALLSPLTAQGGSVLTLLAAPCCAMLLLPRLPALTQDRPSDMTVALMVLAVALAWVIRLHSGVSNAFIYFQF